MPTRLVPMTGQASNYEQVVTLDGVDFTLRLLWNGREDRWYMTIRDADGTDLVTGRKLVSNIPFAVHDQVAGLPDGQLWILDLESTTGDPLLRDLGERVVVMYVDEANVS